METPAPYPRLPWLSETMREAVAAGGARYDYSFGVFSLNLLINQLQTSCRRGYRLIREQER